MNKLTIILSALVVLGLVAGLYVSYHMIKAQRQVKHLQTRIAQQNRSIDNMTNHLDNALGKSMVFLHHSVGHGLLTTGGLSDSLLNLGIVVRGATYGDEIGQQTDINHWLPKFDNDLDRILTFKAHPNQYFEDDRSNDIVMFKSCFPNSGITSDGEGTADPTSSEKTIANYQATFEALMKKFETEPNKLFVYITSPPLNPGATAPDQAARAKKFNDWLVQKVSELPENKNLVIYNLFGFLSDDQGFLKPEYLPNSSTDSHPNAQANLDAAGDFIRFFAPVWKQWNERI